ncbi:vWA domain-containing protein [Enhygromyxa salina]|nr:vWA domain-containing protein [Enhygromyxa salina]
MSRLSLGPTLTLLTGCAMAMAMTSGCLNHPLKPVELEKGEEKTRPVQLTVNKDVDILFVIDNSGSMGEEQAILANNFGSFIQKLEEKDVEANYRLGITTSDNGNEWCGLGATTPEAGNLVLSSCKSRIGDFIFNSGETDVTDLACNDICTLDADALEVLPSTTDYDSTPKPRKWLENIEGKKNIPEGTSTEDAFKCFGPQGINGCGFESQLESMYLALIRAQNAEEVDSYGFLRASAILAVVFVTDEADCSYNKTYAEIFKQDGNRVFWSDPAAAFPTSAVCWNAGVDCEGDPNNYDTCSAVNKDVNGNSGVDNSQAVLHPMSRYIGLLDGLEKEKQQVNEAQEVIVALIGGVANDGTPFYGDVGGTNPMFQNSFGIGPGCEAPNPINPAEPVQAVPPVRLRDLVEEFTPGNMFSICQQDYSDAMVAIADRIREQIQPACYANCVKDTDASTEIVEPECTVEEDPPGDGNDVKIEECLKDAAGYIVDGDGAYTMPGPSVNVCYVLLTDNMGITNSPADDMSDECVDLNYNLEFKVERRPGFPAVGGTSISATCSLADFENVSCPGIGG